MEMSMGYRPRGETSRTFLRVLMLQRASQYGRQVHGYEDLRASLRHEAGMQFVGPHELEGLQPIEQFELTSKASVLIGAHGAGLAWLANMEDTSAVLELHSCLAPNWILCTEEWNGDR